MNTSPTRPETFELWFARLFNAGRGYVFPCDREGHVDLDALSDRALTNYLYARSVIGREFCTPVTCAVGLPSSE